MTTPPTATARRPSVLIVDDDARLVALVSEYLGKNDFDVTVAGDGERGLAMLTKQGAHFDAVLLDVMLPGLDGLEVCRRIRARPEHARLPILMLTAKGDDVDKIIGLELGADDYLAKPFNPRELLARLRAVLRRAGSTSSERDVFKSGDLEVDFDAREVSVGGVRQVLTHFEFELLSQLVRAAGRVLSRDFLMETLKGEEFETFDRSIDVHISRLRAKIEADPKEPRHIKTVRGVGYLLVRE